MPLLDRIKTFLAPELQTLSLKAKSAPYPSEGGGGWIGWDSRPGIITLADVRAEYSSVVMNCVGAITQVFPEAPIRVMRSTQSGVAEEVHGHAVTALLGHPNDFFSPFEMWGDLLVDYLIYGNAYLYKVRNALGLPIELWPLPAEAVFARWPKSGDPLVSHYEYQVNGKRLRLEAEDVIHFRFARKGLDWRAGRDGRYGRSPIADVTPDIGVDQQAALSTRTMLRKGHPGVLFVPKEPVEMTDTQREAFYADFHRRYDNEGLGDPMIMKVPMDVKKLSFDLQELALKDVRRIAEERVSGALRVPPLVAGLGVGIDATGTKANFAEAYSQMWLTCVVPTQREIASKVTADLIPELGRPGEFVEFDTTKIQALQEDRNDLVKRELDSLAGGGIKLNEFRVRVGRDSLGDEGEVFYVPNTVTVVLADAMLERANAKPEPVAVDAPVPLRAVAGMLGMKQLPQLAASLEDAAARDFLRTYAPARYREILDATEIEEGAQ